jgi:hypothetical protein
MAQMVTSDMHPLHTTRVFDYLENSFGLDQPALDRWTSHWVSRGRQDARSHARSQSASARRSTSRSARRSPREPRQAARALAPLIHRVVVTSDRF